MKKLDKILLVDDSEATNEMNKYFINKMDVCEETIVALNGKQALEKLNSLAQNQEELPKLILLDINMPVMDGFEFLEEYEKIDDSLKQAIVVILLTSSMSESDKERARQFQDVKDFVNKPLSEISIEEILNKHF